jgi:Na+/glutamate symporter
MELSNEQKTQVAISVLEERNKAAHNMRERSMRFTLWLSGLAIPIGWLLIEKQKLILSQKLALALFILALFGGTIWFLRGMQRGFQKNREVMIRCEEALGLHKTGDYLEDRPLLSTEYASSGKKWSDHFSTLSVWLLTVALSLFILIWRAPEPTPAPASQKTIPTLTQLDKTKGEK